MSARSSESDASDREVVLTRVIDAPRELVWKVWTDPAHLAQWWGPQGFTTTTHSMRVAVGGDWRYVMHGPDGRDYENRMHYLEVEAPLRLRYKQDGDTAGAGGEPIHFEVTTTFDVEPDGRTRVTMRSVFPSAKARDFVVREYNAIEGGKQHLARLEQHLALARGATAGGPAPFVISRVFRAPRELVFAAWTQREHLEQWFGPKGCKLSVPRLELRPGGVMHYGMHFEGGEMWGRWVFREITPPARLEFTISFADANGNVVRAPHDVGKDSDSDDGCGSTANWPLHMLAKVRFDEHAGKGKGTLVTVEVSALEPTAAEQAVFDGGHDSQRGGWTGTLDVLEAYLARLAR